MFCMKLFLVHCGFYDQDLCDGVYESHVNFFVAADSFETARAKAKQLPAVQAKRMHVDGLQEITAVDGYRLHLQEDATLQGQTVVISSRHRELAPKTNPAQTSFL